MYQRGLMAISGDPIHYGHLQLIKDAKARCKKLFVLVGDNPQKRNSYLFTLSERTAMVRRVVKDLVDVEVIEPPTHVLADTYLRYNCDRMFRGVRNEVDWQYESAQMMYHKLINPNFNWEAIEAQPDYAIISSTMVKEFVRHHIDTSKYVPLFIKSKLEQRINKQYKVAITGQMAVGKSWVTDKLVSENLTWTWKSSPEFNIVHSIKIDEIIRSVYEDQIPGAVAMREAIHEICLGQGVKNVLKEDKTIDRKALGSFMFTKACSDEIRRSIEKLTMPLIHMRYREALTALGPGIVLVEWAQLAEMDMCSWTNNNVIVVDSPDRHKLIKARGLSPEQVEDRSRFQWTAADKIAKITEQIQMSGQGKIWPYSNTMSVSNIKTLKLAIKKYFGGNNE